MGPLVRALVAAARRLRALTGGLLAPADGIAPRGAGVRRTPLERLPEGGGLGGLGGDGGGGSC